MAFIRFGHGSQLYIYPSGFGKSRIYVCCQCPRDYANKNFDSKEQLKEHVLDHKQRGNTIGLVGSALTYQSYDELLGAIDDYDENE
jgi:2-polyprenyl-6-methoxyphenol hydroxylase-like FAD-dependent oxidoreductase